MVKLLLKATSQTFVKKIKKIPIFSGLIKSKLNSSKYELKILRNIKFQRTPSFQKTWNLDLINNIFDNYLDNKAKVQKYETINTKNQL